MEISGEDVRANSAGAYSTGSGLHQQQEWWNEMPLPDDQTQEPDWWNQTHVPSRDFGEQERSGRRPAPADSTEASGQSVEPSPPVPMQLMNTSCHAEEHSESNVPDHLWVWWTDDQQRQWLQVQRWNNGDLGTSMGLWHNHSWDQWNRWIARINGHLGLLVAMMMIGGRRGHNGTVNQRSISTRPRLQNGTEIILRKRGATIVAH